MYENTSFSSQRVHLQKFLAVHFCVCNLYYYDWRSSGMRIVSGEEEVVSRRQKRFTVKTRPRTGQLRQEEGLVDSTIDFTEGPQRGDSISVVLD